MSAQSNNDVFILPLIQKVQHYFIKVIYVIMKLKFIEENFRKNYPKLKKYQNEMTFKTFIIS